MRVASTMEFSCPDGVRLECLWPPKVSGPAMFPRTNAPAMAEIVNLNRVRKARERAADKAVASTNRVAHGLTKAQREAARAERTRAERLIDGHMRED